MLAQPTDQERRLLAGGDRLLGQLMVVDLEDPEIQTKMGGAWRIEVWQTESASSDTQVTVMEFDARGCALRASIFPNIKAAEHWMAVH